MSCWLIDLGPLGLYEDIDDARPRARDSCMSYATENIDYLIKAPQRPQGISTSRIGRPPKYTV